MFEGEKHMKELFELYLLFFKLGIVNFGGGYAMLPLLERELVDRKKWSTSEDIADYFAIQLLLAIKERKLLVELLQH